MPHFWNAFQTLLDSFSEQGDGTSPSPCYIMSPSVLRGPFFLEELLSLFNLGRGHLFTHFLNTVLCLFKSALSRQVEKNVGLHIVLFNTLPEVIPVMLPSPPITNKVRMGQRITGRGNLDKKAIPDTDWILIENVPPECPLLYPENTCPNEWERTTELLWRVH